LSGATVLRGAAGFGVHSQVHTAAIVDLAVGLPEVIIVVDDSEVIERVLPIVEEMVGEGLILVEDVQAIRKNSKHEQSRTKSEPSVEVGHAVSEYMDGTPITVSAEQSFAHIVEVLISHQRANLPVVSETGVLLGMISSQDLLGRIVHIPEGPF